MRPAITWYVSASESSIAAGEGSSGSESVADKESDEHEGSSGPVSVPESSEEEWSESKSSDANFQKGITPRPSRTAHALTMVPA